MADILVLPAASNHKLTITASSLPNQPCTARAALLSRSACARNRRQSRTSPPIVGSRPQDPPQVPRWCDKLHCDYASKVVQLQRRIGHVRE